MRDVIIMIFVFSVLIIIPVLVILAAKKDEREAKQRRANMTPEEIEEENKKNEIQKKAEKGIPENVSCPFCKGKKLDVKNPITTLGWALIIIGLFFTPFYGVGILLILIGVFVRQKKFYCIDCNRNF